MTEHTSDITELRLEGRLRIDELEERELSQDQILFRDCRQALAEGRKYLGIYQEPQIVYV